MAAGVPRTGMRAISARSPRSSSCARASLSASVPSSLRAVSKPCAKRHTASSTVTSSAISRRPGFASRQRAWCSSASHQNVLTPSGRLHAASMSRSSFTAPSAGCGARSQRNARLRYGSNPWNGTPSFQRSASVPEENRSATRFPAMPAGISPSSRNQAVLHTGPQRQPISTGTYACPNASSGVTRSGVCQTVTASGERSGNAAGSRISETKFSKRIAAYCRSGSTGKVYGATSSRPTATARRHARSSLAHQAKTQRAPHAWDARWKRGC